MSNIFKNSSKKNMTLPHNKWAIGLYFILMVFYMIFRIKEVSLFLPVALVMVLIVVFLPVENTFYVLIMTVPYHMYFLFSSSGGACINFIYIFLIIKLVYFGEGRFDGQGLLPVAIIIFFDLIQGLITGISVSTDIIHWSLTFYIMIWFLSSKPFNIDFDKMVKCFALGMGILSILVIIFNWNSMLDVSTRNDIIGNAQLEKNEYSAYVVIAVTSIINMFIKNKKVEVLYIFISITCLLSAFFFLSKNFVVVFAFCLVLYVCTQIENFHVVIFLTVAIISLLLFVRYNSTMNNLMNVWIDRFTSAKDASDLTTGRTDVIKNYIEFLLNDPITMSFGKGFTTYTQYIYQNSNINVAPHNGILQMIVSWGVIGTIIFISYMFSLVKRCQRVYSSKSKLTYFIPLLSYLLSMQSMPILTARITPFVYMYCVLCAVGFNRE